MNVAVFFGGKSCEHNISVITGMQAIKAISRKHNVVPVYIDGDGVWHTGKKFADINTYREGKASGGKTVHIRPASPYLRVGGRKLLRIDVALLCNHGVNGEDGSLQGLLQLCGVPYTGSGVRASAASMDKITMKHLFTQAGLPVLPFISFSREEYESGMFKLTEEIKEKLTFPLIVKPSNLGSSIGISIARDFESLFAAVDVALKWDDRILIENALEDFTELNCAVLGRGKKLTASEIEQPIGWTEFLTYDDKYNKKMKGGGRKFPAEIEPEMREKVQTMAKDAFDSLGCEGVARVDFLLKDSQLYVNEINTIPGALSNYLFTGAGEEINFEELIDRLLSLATERFQAENALQYTYESNFDKGKGCK